MQAAWRGLWWGWGPRFTVHVEWLCSTAVGMPEGVRLSHQEVGCLDMPEINVRNKEGHRFEGPRKAVRLARWS